MHASVFSGVCVWVYMNIHAYNSNGLVHMTASVFMEVRTSVHEKVNIIL